MTPAEFQQIGQKIGVLSEKLVVLNDERTGIDSEIAELETELRPLVEQHSAHLAGLLKPVGSRRSPAQEPGQENSLPPDEPVQVSSKTPDPKMAYKAAKHRVMKFLNGGAPAGMAAPEIASALHMDLSVVREIMADLMRGNV